MKLKKSNTCPNYTDYETDSQGHSTDNWRYFPHSGNNETGIVSTKEVHTQSNCLPHPPCFQVDILRKGNCFFIKEFGYIPETQYSSF